ncbi:gamma-glutamylcyclotransferase [Photobacterium halotolerans]|uniref:gamma-glutamylcyclotransferase n=1 Tax=Photobacterium halotolerans TaxID=265726 RepID=UPI0013733A4F|nr:gamma-glutamylcyclotransferase [Photobacterium halotolerans]
MHTRVFVYGSLRRGQSNHGLLSRARYLGECQLAGYAMYNLGPYPAALKQPGSEGVLFGEVYDVDADTFRELDILEGLGEEYCREQVETSFGLAWIYLYLQPLDRASLIPQGDWSSWSSR